MTNSRTSPHPGPAIAAVKFAACTSSPMWQTSASPTVVLVVFVKVRLTFALPAAVGWVVVLLMNVVGLKCDTFGARPAPHVALHGPRPATHAFFRPASDTRHALNFIRNPVTHASSAG